MSTTSSNMRKDKNQNQNIQVFVRLRPLNAREKDIKSVGVVEVNGTREVLVRQSPLDSRLSKKFTFDRAFGPNSNQVDVYREVVSPLIDEVLAGYNCTVFAYGQTGTGKTHTMVGDSTPDQDLPWQNDPMSGIIPRSLSQLFDELRITNSEYTVRVSYLELYNEELFDLLSASEDNSKLRIYEDVTRKGSNIVNGLEEVTVYSKNEVYKIMAKGQEKRRMASTLMNAQSSRSHTVFTIVVHMKENSPDGEELMKVGKLNLVDLAGSENISKAGTDNPSRKERARECVNINQSLLTLGRVITALVERHPHIPYRESKLTRLLQESLGGRTKTSIIATISPGHKDVEETLSTLEYANRAKNIQNKPEINQKITKHAVLKEYSEEIDRLKRDLLATREKNGVYLAQETYSEMTLKIEEQEKEIQDKILYIKAVKDEKEKMENLFAEMSNSLHEKNRELDKTNKHLVETKNHLNQTKQKLTETTFKTEEHEYVISKQVETETKLSKQAKDLLSVAEVTTTDIDNLQNTVAKKKDLEEYNLQNTRMFGEKAKSCRIIIKDHVHDFTASHMDSLRSLGHILDHHRNVQVTNYNASKQLMETITDKLMETIGQINTNKDSQVLNFEHFCQDKFGELERNAVEESAGVHNNLANVIKLIDSLDDIRQKDLHNLDTLKLHIVHWNDNSMKKVLQLQEKQDKFVQEMTDKFNQLKKNYEIKEENHHNEYKRLQTMRQQYQQEISKDIVDIKKTLSDKLEALQLKRASHAECIFNTENDLCQDYQKNSSDVAAIIADTSKELSERGKDIADNINDLVHQDNDFHNKINSIISEYSSTLEQQTTSYDLIKNAGYESRSSSMLAWSKHQGIEAAVKETIIQQHKHSVDNTSRSLQVMVEDCKAECTKCSGGLEDSVKRMAEDADENNKQIIVLRDMVEGHKTDMEEHLNVCDVIESTYLEQEYKTYSPTGKTPLRTLYRYPRDLANTSPHDRIRQRFRNYRHNTLQDNELDQTIEELPSNDETRTNNTSSGDDNSSINTTDNDSSRNGEEEVFIKPETPPAQLTDIFDDQQLKENLSQDKKEFTSKLKQPFSVKKVLGAKN